MIEQYVRFVAPTDGIYDYFYLTYFNQDLNLIGNVYFLPNASGVSLGVAGNSTSWPLNYSQWYFLKFTFDFANNTIDIALGDNPPFATDQVLSDDGLPLNLGAFGYFLSYADPANPGNAYMDIDDVRVAAILPPSSPGQINEPEPNNDFASAFELFEEAFTLDADPDILDSTTVPHVSVLGSGDGTFDYYKITLDRDNSTLVADIDYTASLDSYLGVWDESGALVLLNDDAVGGTAPGAGGSTSIRDSFISLTGLDAGTYYIGVAAYPAGDSGTNSSYSAGSTPIGAGATYELQVPTSSFIPGDSEISIAAPGGDLVSGGAPVNLGNSAVGVPASAVTFTIRNDGTDTLSCLAILAGGANVADFAVDDSLLPPSLPPGGTADFTVTFTPGGPGERTANLRLASNDADENPFQIALSGSGAPAEREIVVEQAGSPLMNMLSLVSLGSVEAGGTSSLDLTIRNTGTTNLEIQGASIAGSDAADFSIITTPTANLAYEEQMTLTIEFNPSNPSIPGERRAHLVIANNDSDENPFEIDLSGHVLGDLPDDLLHEIPAPPVGYQGGAQLGTSVAASGHWVAMGAPFADINGLNSGEIKVFSAGTGQLVHTLRYTGGRTTDAFFGSGHSLALSGNRLLAGDYRSLSGGSFSGRALVYDLAGPTPDEPVLILENPSPDEDDYFGYAVALSGDIAVIGAYGDDTAGSSRGAVYVYDLSGLTPEVPILTLSDASYLNFGFVVAVDGRKVVVCRASSSAPAYVFDLDSPTPGTPVATLENSLGDIGYGQHATISGDRVVIGSWQDPPYADYTGRIYVYDLSGVTPGAPILTIDNPETDTTGYFGGSVALSGSRLAVSARGNGIGGKTYVYDLDGATPSVAQHVIVNPEPDSGDLFGMALALDGPRLIATAPYDHVDLGGTAVFDAGIGYIFDLAGGSPTTPIRELTDASPATGDYFGRAVAISGDTMLVGAPEADLLGMNTGSVSVFDLGAPNPTIPVLTLPAAPSVYFGTSVALSGRTAAVGAPNDATAAPNVGAVYVHALDDPSPELPRLTLTNPNPANDAFGGAVDISGRLVAVGAGGDDTGASNSGKVYIFNTGEATPTTPVITLENPNPANGAAFGNALAIQGTKLVVGARGYGYGRAYVYDFAAPNPTTPILTLSNPSPATSDDFGMTVAISGNRIAIGAGGASSSVQGTVFIYDLHGTTPSSPVLSLPNPDPANANNFGKAVSLVAGQLLVGSGYDYGLPGTSSAGIAYMYHLDGPTPATPVATLANPSPAFGDNFGSAVATDGVRVAIGAYTESTVARYKGAAYVFGIPSPGPEIAIEQPSGVDLVSGSSSVSFGGVAFGAGNTRTFTIRNVGQTTLTVSGASLLGGNDTDFSVVTAPPGSIVAGGSVEFTVMFTPSAAGLRSTTLRIANDDPDDNESPFEITLTGSGATASELLTDAMTNAGLDPDPTAKPYNDGVSNLEKYAFNMNLAGPDVGTLTPDTGTSGLPTYELDDSGPETVVRVQYIRRKGSGLDYTPMKSGDLSAGSFVPMVGTETSEDIDGEFERVTFVSPCDPAVEPSCFWQVRVTIP